MVKLKDIFLDFANYIFLLAIIIFFIFYFISGNRFQEFIEMLQKLTPLIIFAALFLFKFKNSREEMKKYKKELNLDEMLIVFSRIDAVKDYIAIGVIFMLIIGIAIVDGTAGWTDIWQGIVGFLIMLAAHKLLFRKKDSLALTFYATRLDKIIDEVIIFLLPVTVFVFALFKNSPDAIDILQAVFSFAFAYYWRRIQFKKVQ